MSYLRTKENKGIFSGNMLKIFALICMTIDHIGLYLMDNSYPMRAIGRLAFPIFAYMIAEGWKYTRNRTWYFYTIFIMGLAFQTICILADNNYHMNIFITFSLSILLIYSLDYGRNNSETVQWQFPILAVMFVLFVSEIMPMFFGDINYGIDYGFFGITLPLMVYLFDKKELKLIMFTVGLILLCLTRDVIQWWSLLAVIPIAFYNGKRGKLKICLFFFITYYLLRYIMGPYYYVVERISGDYGFLKRTDIQDKDLLQVAMALLPSDIDEGTKLKWENLVYTIID